VTLAVWLALSAPVDAADDRPSQPETDWRDQIVYFLLLDRFADGDPRNNDQGQGEYDPKDSRKFSGGDLAGVRQRLDYVQGLGATAVWITPPVANLWWNPQAGYGGYHGYWASDFKAVDAHFGTLAEYRGLADDLHRRQMRLIQDIVVNHTADYFDYDAGWDPAAPERGFVLHTQPDGRTAPRQSPFDRNDPRDPAQRAEAIYHWTPAVRDYTDPVQERTWQMSNLDDLNTENPAVRRALRDSYGYWVREVGVDAFRVDTAFYVPPEFFDDFLNAEDPAAPGVLRVARDAGKPQFHVFGEGFGIDKPYQDSAARKIETYARGPDGRTLLPAMINFPLYGTLGDVFARGRPPAELGHRIGSMMKVHADPWRMPTFVDNHDVDRFLSGGSEAGLQQALLAIMTLPGIPTIYYGTEQGLRTVRPSLFAAGVGSGGRDHFDTQAPLYRQIARMAALRKAHAPLRRGTPTVLAAEAAGPGAVAWRMDHAGESLLVVMNTADHPALLDNLDTGYTPGVALLPQFALSGVGRVLRPDAQGRLTLTLPPHSGYVWVRGKTIGRTATLDAPRIDPDTASEVGGDLPLRGQAAPGSTVQIVVDGNLAAATRVQADAEGRWQVQLNTEAMIDPTLRHRVVAYAADTGAASPAHAFTVRRQWTLRAEASDPAGDDRGPTGQYQYPTDPGWAARQGDLRGVRVWTSGRALKVELRMAAISTGWNPANGFDRVAFTLYLHLPGQPGGATALPQQNAQMPDGLRWHRRLRSHGWSNALFGAEGADARNDGITLPAAARIAVDREAATVTFTLPAQAIGDAATLDGAKLYVTTWDYDGGYRALGPTPGGHTFGGGPADGAKVLDDALVELR
jgi:glycosidase